MGKKKTKKLKSTTRMKRARQSTRNGGESVAGGGGGGKESKQALHTLRLLQDPVDGARAAAASHGDVEVVVMGGFGGCHFFFWILLVKGLRLKEGRVRWSRRRWWWMCEVRLNGI